MAFPTRLLQSALALAVLAATSPSHAEYPEKPITVIVPFGAGGAGDALLRVVSEPMEAALGQKLVVVARPGAGGNLGAQSVVAAAPDGYTLLLGATGNFVINQFLFTNMGFDPLMALQPITMVADVPAVFFTHPSVPAKDLSEFIAYAKANPGKLNYGSPAMGSTPHLGVEQLKLLAGLDIVHVPFQSAPQGVLALLRNDIQLYLGGVVLAKSYVDDGTLRAIAVASPKRLGAFPGVPTLQETGFNNFDPSNWWMLAAPKGTDPAVVNLLHKTVAAALADKKVRERLDQLGFIPGGQRPAEVASRIATEATLWDDVIKKAKIAVTK
jgi:tripartite-type tricarboxylate transporter receptor subunit TctC